MKEETREEIESMREKLQATMEKYGVTKIESMQAGIQDLATWSIENEKDADDVARELNNLIERIYNLDFSDDEE